MREEWLTANQSLTQTRHPKFAVSIYAICLPAMRTYTQCELDSKIVLAPSLAVMHSLA